MTIKEIKDLHDAVPFKPFTLNLNSGRNVTIPSIDHLFIAPNKKHLVAYDADEHLYIVDLENISALVIT